MTLRDRLSRAWNDGIWVQPTRAGVWFGLLMLGLMLAGINTGNNLIYAALSLLLAMLVTSNALAEYNLRGLSVRRELVGDLFAETPSDGAFLLRNHRRIGGAWSITVEEADGTASASVVYVPVGAEVAVPVQWTFPQRGRHHLEAIRLSSAYPFGFVRRTRTVRIPGDVVVYPRRGSGASEVPRLSEGGREEGTRSGDGSEVIGVRSYASGDPVNRIHWPTTARTGAPMVLLRNAPHATEVVVRVAAASGDAWERALSRACGELERHFVRGDAVGLSLVDEMHPPRAGEEWRRELLARLALTPKRPA